MGGHVEVWFDPAGREVSVVACECRRCGSTTMFAPSPDGLERIRVRVAMEASVNGR